MSFYGKIICNFIILFIIVFYGTFSCANDVPRYNKIETEHIAGLPLQWSPVPFADYMKVLQFLQSQSQSNLAGIRTLNSDYSVEFSQQLTTAQMSELTGSSKFRKSTIQTQHFDLEFVIDTKNNHIYRKKTVTGNSFKQIDTLAEIETKNIQGKEHVSIMKDGTFTERDLSKQSAFRELPDYPNLIEKKVARKYSAVKVTNMDLCELINPLDIIDLKNCEPLDVAIRTLRSPFPAEAKKMSSYYFIYEANTPIKWYTIQVVSDDNTYHRKLIRRTFWNESVGFLQLGMFMYVIKNDGSEELSFLTTIGWQNSNGIFVPEKIQQVYYLPDGSLSFSRSLNAKKLEVNTHLNPTQFELSALGLEDDDYLLDEIKQRVFIVQNNKPVYLAKFYEKYQTPQERSFNRVRMFIMLLGFALIVLGIYLKIRRRRIENKK